MNSMFYGCKSLNNLPYISKWNIKKVKDKSAMFYGCSLLSNIPKQFS